MTERLLVVVWGTVSIAAGLWITRQKPPERPQRPSERSGHRNCPEDLTAP